MSYKRERKLFSGGKCQTPSQLRSQLHTSGNSQKSHFSVQDISKASAIVRRKWSDRVYVQQTDDLDKVPVDVTNKIQHGVYIFLNISHSNREDKR